MTSTLNRIILVSIASCASMMANGQELNVIQKAMIDELDRNMKELRLEGHDAPFFINYTLTDQTSTKIFASLGALIGSSESPQRVKTSIRVLVGDYDFNDESLDNNLFSASQANEISMPLDDDYLGIRRSFWISTDNVYRNAAKQFKKNQETLKDQNKPLVELPHRSFAKTPVSKVDVVGAEMSFNRADVENYLRELSAIFKDYPEIRNSGVAFGYDRGHRYQVNSEGSINRTPIGLALLSISAQMRTPEGDIPFTEMKRIYSTPAAMPPLVEMKKEVKTMIEDLMQSAKAKAFDEEYSGPVLYEGAAVADVMIASLFGGEESLEASNSIPNLKGFRYDENPGIDGKIGKPLFAKGMTVKALPKLRRYNGEELLGAFEVDDEGVVPADELVLVENGVLMNLLNDRTLVKEGQQANGLGSGPGVVSITFPSGIAESELKAKLISLAKQQGLEYALIVRETFGSFGMVNVYKVSLETGAEELMRAATLSALSLKDFKRVSEVSAGTQVQNLSFGGAGIISAIVPKGLLLEEVEVGVSRMPRLTEEEYVASPLHK